MCINYIYIIVTRRDNNNKKTEFNVKRKISEMIWDATQQHSVSVITVYRLYASYVMICDSMYREREECLETIIFYKWKEDLKVLCMVSTNLLK
jgi:hypothetical protein